MPDFPAPPMSFPSPVPPPPPVLPAPLVQSIGWHEPRAATPSPMAPPPPPAPTVPPAAEPAKKSFSAAELDHVPRYIAPDEDRPQESPAAPKPRSLSGDWQPNELASFSGAEWVPPAVAQDDARAYVAPKAPSTEAVRSPRNLIIVVMGVALVAGLGFGVSKALAPDSSKIVVETPPATTVVKSRVTTPNQVTTVAARPTTPLQPAQPVGEAQPAGPAQPADAAEPTSGVAQPAPGLVGVANALAPKAEEAVENALEVSTDGASEAPAAEAPAP
jgi:hypothetical protein